VGDLYAPRNTFPLGLAHQHTSPINVNWPSKPVSSRASLIELDGLNNADSDKLLLDSSLLGFVMCTPRKYNLHDTLKMICKISAKYIV
jgi:hypothetical protein